jgi:hypothetical protein
VDPISGRVPAVVATTGLDAGYEKAVGFKGPLSSGTDEATVQMSYPTDTPESPQKRICGGSPLLPSENHELSFVLTLVCVAWYWSRNDAGWGRQDQPLRKSTRSGTIFLLKKEP